MKSSPKRLWRAFERLADGAVVSDWIRELGEGLDRVRPFLKLVNGLAGTYPCTNSPGCGHPHRVEEIGAGKLVAVCDGDEWCSPIDVEAKDLFVFAADTQTLCGGICRCLRLGAPGSGRVTGARVERVGTYGPAGSEVYLMFPADSARMMREVERLFCAQPDPFIVLTPTGVHCTPDVETMLRRQLCMHVTLSGTVMFRADGSMAATPAAGPLFEEFGLRKRQGRGGAAAAAVRFVFQRDGRHWTVIFDGAEFVLENTLGARYLDYLLHHPAEAITAYDLEVTISPEKAKVRTKNTIQNDLDPDTIRSYLREVDGLRDKRAQAAEEGHQSEVDRLDDEIGQIEAALKKGGIAADTGERARGNVSKAIAAVQRKLAKGNKHEKTFGMHIKECVSMGYNFRYAHPTGGVWQ